MVVLFYRQEKRYKQWHKTGRNGVGGDVIFHYNRPPAAVLYCVVQHENIHTYTVQNGLLYRIGVVISFDYYVCPVGSLS